MNKKFELPNCHCKNSTKCRSKIEGKCIALVDTKFKKGICPFKKTEQEFKESEKKAYKYGYGEEFARWYLGLSFNKKGKE